MPKRKINSTMKKKKNKAKKIHTIIKCDKDDHKRLKYLITNKETAQSCVDNTEALTCPMPIKSPNVNKEVRVIHAFSTQSCRLCLSESRLCESVTTWTEHISTVCGLKMTPEVEFPQKLCIICIHTLTLATALRETAHRTEMLLRTCSEPDSKPDITEILNSTINPVPKPPQTQSEEICIIREIIDIKPDPDEPVEMHTSESALDYWETDEMNLRKDEPNEFSEPIELIVENINLTPTPITEEIDTQIISEVDTQIISEVDTQFISEVDTQIISEVDTQIISEVDTLTIPEINIPITSEIVDVPHFDNVALIIVRKIPSHPLGLSAKYCAKCLLPFQNSESLKLHLKYHNIDICTFCNFQFKYPKVHCRDFNTNRHKTLNIMNEHSYSHFKDPYRRNRKTICRFHSLKKKFGKKTRKKNSKYICDVCHTIFFSKRRIIYHLSNIHRVQIQHEKSDDSDEINNSTPHLNLSLLEDTENEKYMEECKHCMNTFSTTTELKLHELTHCTKNISQKTIIMENDETNHIVEIKYETHQVHNVIYF